MSDGLTVESLFKSYPTRSGELRILRDISLTLARGRSAVVMGPSGSGKSTLLNILGTLDTPTRGKVLLDGQDPFAFAERELAEFRNTRLGFIFQEHHLLPQCTALENVLLPSLAGRPTIDRLERAQDLLERVGLGDRLDHRPAELSGGERQRAAIARALVNEPVLVLADEPTGNLDRTTAAGIGDLLAELPERNGVVLLVVTHSSELAERFEQRFEIDQGTLVPR